MFFWKRASVFLQICRFWRCVFFFWEIAKHIANYGFGFTDFYKEELLNWNMAFLHLWILAFSCISFASSSVNLLLPMHETNKLLGKSLTFTWNQGKNPEIYSFRNAKRVVLCARWCLESRSNWFQYSHFKSCGLLTFFMVERRLHLNSQIQSLGQSWQLRNHVATLLEHLTCWTST